MKVTQEKIDALNAVIRIELAPEDYKDNLGKTLKDYAKKANIKGFRPGLVPVGVVKKMYGPSILLDELQKILSEKLHSYLTEEKIELLGEPVPRRLADINLDPEATQTYHFEYEIGLPPAFNLSLTGFTTPPIYKITMDDESLEKEVKTLRERYSKYDPQDAITDSENMVVLEFSKSDTTENGIPSSFTRAIKTGNLASAELLKALIGKKVDEEAGEWKITDIYANEAEIKRVLREILAEETDPGQSIFEAFSNQMWQIKVKRIVKMMPAEENNEFYAQIFPGRDIYTAEDFRTALRADMEKFYGEDADLLFRSKAMEAVLASHELPLPDEFLKKWLKETSEKITDETLAKEYVDFARMTRWQLISKVIRADNPTLTVGKEDMMDEARKRARGYFVRNQEPAPEEQIDVLAQSILKDQELANKIYREKMDSQIFDWLREALSPTEKPVTVKEYLEINAPVA